MVNVAGYPMFMILQKSSNLLKDKQLQNISVDVTVRNILSITMWFYA